MATYGYARVSSTGQSLELQREALKAAGCEIIREEKVSGTSRKGRHELNTLLDFLCPGDELVVTKIDRLARSVSDLQTLAESLSERGVGLRAIEQPVDTKTAAGKAFFQMLGVFSEFETNLRKERQMEGIAKAKLTGVYRGRKPSINQAEIRNLKQAGFGATEISKKLGISRTSVYRLCQ